MAELVPKVLSTRVLVLEYRFEFKKVWSELCCQVSEGKKA